VSRSDMCDKGYYQNTIEWLSYEFCRSSISVISAVQAHAHDNKKRFYVLCAKNLCDQLLN